MVDGRDLTNALEALAESYPDAQIAIVHNEKNDGSDMAWAVMITFGQEADDSPMVGGAAHGLAGRADEALEQALRECGVWFR